MRLPRLLAMVVLVPLIGTGNAFADEVTTKLDRYELEARQLGSDLPESNPRARAVSAHALTDAEIAYSLGDYDAAALQLFDLAARSQGTDKEAATYYLAESLYQKGDLITAKINFKLLADSSFGKYRVQALVRLLEIAIKQHDESADTTSVVNALHASGATPQVAYVLGKHQFSLGNYDEALQQFAAVPKGSDQEMEAAYFTATTYVAKKDLVRATDLFTDLIGRKPRTPNDRRMIELAQLALGRLYYERGQPAKSIDSYLLVDRHSDLFPDALYEVGWVYVKNKQYDKALRTLELLQKSEPTSTRTPTVRILEGNLRIRKAQMLRSQQISGTINTEESSDPAVEYEKAARIFTQTHDQFAPAYQVLAEMVNGKLDAASFVDQIGGRTTHVFQVSAPIPDAATQMLRDEPNVQVFDATEDELGDIEANIAQSETIIRRLDAIIASGDRTAIYPALAARRSRIGQIQDDLVGMRSRLADAQNDGSPETAARRALAQQYAALGNSEQAYSQRVTSIRDGYDQIQQTELAVANAIDSSQAMAVALRTWATSAVPPLADDKKTHITQTLDDAGREAIAIEDELAQLRNELALGKDLSGVSDTQIQDARKLRKQLKDAEDAEQRALSGHGRSTPALERAARLADQLEQTDQAIDHSVANGIEDTKVQIAAERKLLAEYKAEMLAYEHEAREAGASVLAASFQTVKAKLYDVVVRADVGNVDVSWAQKSDLDDELKRLNLARSRELKQLKDEFKDILQDAAARPPVHKEPATPAKTEGTEQSPDTSPAGDRVKSTEPSAPTSTAPAVKPGGATPAQKGGSK